MQLNFHIREIANGIVVGCNHPYEVYGPEGANQREVYFSEFVELMEALPQVVLEAWHRLKKQEHDSATTKPADPERYPSHEPNGTGMYAVERDQYAEDGSGLRSGLKEQYAQMYGPQGQVQAELSGQYPRTAKDALELNEAMRLMTPSENDRRQTQRQEADRLEQIQEQGVQSWRDKMNSTLPDKPKHLSADDAPDIQDRPF